MDIKFDIDALIAKYGPVVVDAARQQVRVAIIEDLLWTAFGVVLAYIAFRLGRFCWRTWKSDGRDYDDDGPMVLSGIGATILGLFAFFCIVAGGGEALTFILNPTWAVVQMVAKLAK